MFAVVRVEVRGEKAVVQPFFVLSLCVERRLFRGIYFPCVVHCVSESAPSTTITTTETTVATPDPSGLSRQELQSLAKETDGAVKANQSTPEIKNGLRKLGVTPK